MSTQSSSLLLISGSLRDNSTNTATLRTVVEVSAPLGFDSTLYGGLGALPHFNPDCDNEDLPRSVGELRAQIRNVDAVIFCTPEYAGALPGSFKNLLDWTVGDDHVRSLNRKPVAWLNVSPRGAVRAHESLRAVLGYLGTAIIESACISIPVDRGAVGDDGLISSRASRAQIVSAMARIKLAIS